MLCYVVFLIPTVFAQWNETFEREYKNQAELVANLVEQGFIQSKRVEEVMTKVDIEIYEGTYVDKYPPLYAYLLETLKDHLKNGTKVLNIAYGAGYLTTCFAHMIGEAGYVVQCEKEKVELELPESNVRLDDRKLLDTKRIRFKSCKNQIGAPKYGPYDVINIGALPSKVPPQLLKQLKNGGRLIVPIVTEVRGELKSKIQIIDKNMDGTLNITEELGVFGKINYFAK